MANQGFYIKFGEFAGKTTSLDTQLQVKEKKKAEAAQDDRNSQTMNTYVQKIFSNTEHKYTPAKDQTYLNSYMI